MSTPPVGKHMPDSPAANEMGCRCPIGANNRGLGMVEDGFRSYTVNPECKIHSDPRWWFFRAAEKTTAHEKGR